MTPNPIVLLLAALIPTLVGFIWYHPKVMGGMWMRVTGLREEDLKQGNMAVIFGVSLVLSVFLSFALHTIVIHQYGFYQTLMNYESEMNTAGTEINNLRLAFEKYANEFRTFRHGAIHGALTGIILILPVLGTNALFERKGWSYIFVNVAYWTITLALMGGVICQWSR
ncbi:MAG: DUF1761 domain-containing protein [Sphingobacteriales bacterium]|nr:DUF1761 domain-containing protein [Sphingobacteriales bacterium]